MDVLLPVLLVGGLLYLAYNSGALTQFGISPPTPLSPLNNPGGLQPSAQFTNPPVTLPRTPVVTNAPVTSANTGQLAITGAASVGTAAISAPSSFAALGLTGAAAGAAVAGIGAVVAIGAALYAAHLARVRQAKDENSAVNLGVQGFDSDLKQVNAAYNARQIDAASAISLVKQILANYWALVTPHIQPGRNGCGGGNGCPPWPASGNGCSGSIGAACCVGCYDLAGGAQPATLAASDGGDGVNPYYFGIGGTIAVLQHGGGPVAYQYVYGSKYGGQNRPGYRLNWVQAGS